MNINLIINDIFLISLILKFHKSMSAKIILNEILTLHTHNAELYFVDILLY
jgi:hypothetical protein